MRAKWREWNKLSLSGLLWFPTLIDWLYFSVFIYFSTILFLLVLLSVRIERIDTHCSCKIVKKNKERLWERNDTLWKKRFFGWNVRKIRWRIYSFMRNRIWIKHWKTLQTIWYCQNWQNIYLLFIENYHRKLLFSAFISEGEQK